jgi:hypothetical protein
MRRRADLQRTRDESKSYQESLNRLIECIRDGPSSRFETLVEYIRGGASNQEIIDAVQRLRGSAEDDSDNTSLLHKNSLESPPGERADELGVFRGAQLDESFLVDGEEKHTRKQGLTKDTSPSRSGKGKEDEQVANISSLLSKLKTLPSADGEHLLRQIVTSQSPSGHSPSVAGSASTSLDAFDRIAVDPSSVERSMWHPALHVHLESAWVEEQRKVGTGLPVLAPGELEENVSCYF